MFRAEVILDSMAPCGIRLTSMELTYPRFIHSEFMTHRDRERNAASSRAIPAQKLRDMVRNDPVIPIRFGREAKGMQQGDSELDLLDQGKAIAIIEEMMQVCLNGSEELSKLGLHKSICNRYIEPWMWITVLTTATEWKNFFRLRCHPAAEPHFQLVANMARKALEASVPVELEEGEWHTPYIVPDDYNGNETTNDLLKVSTGRCARLSYLTQKGLRDLSEDIGLHDRLLKPPGDPDENIMHASPFGHVAQATNDAKLRSGPFRGWKQYRKLFPNENIIG